MSEKVGKLFCTIIPCCVFLMIAWLGAYQGNWFASQASFTGMLFWASSENSYWKMLKLVHSYSELTDRILSGHGQAAAINGGGR